MYAFVQIATENSIIFMALYLTTLLINWLNILI
nr:MAG TPA: hypothetical protein [Caudoviricetes sp.]